jgi:hypothetical protein
VLERLPFAFLAARGFSVTSLADRLVRAPFRPEVLAVDYLQAVVRPTGAEVGAALRGLSDLASALHLAVICAVRAAADDPSRDAGIGAVQATGLAARLGWIAPAETSDARRAEVVHNRYGRLASASFRLESP